MELFFRREGAGVPVYILHGLFGCADNWSQISKRLSDCADVVVVDLRNHGRSPHSEEWDYHCMAEDVVELMDRLHHKQAIVVGHSMGGKVAMHLSLLHPNRMLGMMVVDIAPRYYTPHHQQVLDALWSVDFSKHKSRKDCEQVLENLIVDAGTRQFLLKNLFWETLSDGSLQLAWKMNLPVITRHIEEVGQASPKPHSSEVERIPVLFVRGAKSNYINSEDIIQIKEYYPNSKLETIEDAGHWVQAEQPEAFLACLKAFVADVELHTQDFHHTE
jgi:pimeloyl-ACP methyl ester carboxylesterase